MQFTTLALSALSIGCALAGSSTVQVHVVKVGGSNGSLTYSPDSLTAAVGDMIQFQFGPKNHTVTQSSFDFPCNPLAMHTSNVGVYSGFMPVAATATETPTYTILVNATTPMWFYCSQGKHCQAGMVMVVNENTKANSTRSLANYKSMAAKVTTNLPGNSVSNGTSGQVSDSSSGTSASGSGSSAGSTSTSSGAASTTSSSMASGFKASESYSFAALIGLAVALFI